MTISLLTTKLYIPHAHHNLVPRPHLIEQLNNSLQRKLALISAPAGYGKTTLVGEWVQAMGGAAPPGAVAWLSLDEGDNNPVRFLSYLIAALQTVEANLAKGELNALQSPQPPAAEDILTALLNEIAAIPGRILLILDDYHLIEAETIHNALTFLLKHLPPQMHLVITTREDPPLNLARLRARRQLTELRAVDLRFTTSEAAEFLNHVMGLDLSADDITALERRTEGWITGLQLAAISLRGRQDAAALIRSFAGSHRYVLDYLIEEVLEQQPQGVQTFLLQTAILDRLTGSLCDAVTGQDDGQATLEYLEQGNLFIIPLDNERRCYRYHRLFADLLRQRLRQTKPDWVPALHRRASEWYEQNRFVDEAIEHALCAKEFERSARLIEEYGDALWERGEHVKFRAWLARLPVELMFSRPHLCIFHAWYSFISGEQDAAEQSLHAAEQAIDVGTDRATRSEFYPQDSLTSPDSLRLQGRVAAIQAFMNSHRGDVPGIVHHARQALELLPEQDRVWRNMTAIALGDVYGFQADMKAAHEARSEALQACKMAGDIYCVMLASLKLAITERSQGRLQRTMEICQQQIQTATECGLSNMPVVGSFLVVRGEVLAESNDLDEALQQATRGIELAKRGVDLAFLGWDYMCLARILFSRGELADLHVIIEEMQNIAQDSNVPPWVMNQMAAWQTRLWLAQSDLEAASRWARERGLTVDGEPVLPHQLDFFSLLDYLVLTRILIAQGRLDETAELLERLLKAAEAGGRTSRVIEILVLQALTRQAQGSTDRAVIKLERALTLAEPEGFVRIFVDEGPPMARLLLEALSRGIAPGYVRRLLEAFPVTEPGQAVLPKSPAPQSDLIEPLSERELEVLQLIAQGLTNPEIATRLYLSPNTVKVHTRNIYGKLGVRNRTQAGARGRALGILPSH
jgi:LuxR family maltose regulon positive regulatory protein